MTLTPLTFNGEAGEVGPYTMSPMTITNTNILWKYTNKIRDQTQTKHISKYKYDRKYKCKYKCEYKYKYKHKVGTLHQVAYYENPGILMIVQSVEDQEGTKTNQGDWWNQDQSKSILQSIYTR